MSLAQINQDRDRDFQRLSSGRRVTSAKDDAAGLAVITKMSAQIASLSQAQRNVGDSFSMTEVASGGLDSMTESASRIRELAMQAANGSMGASEKSMLQDEINSITKGMDQVSQGTKFGGQKLLDGSLSSSAQAGPDQGDSIAFSVGDMSVAGLGLQAIDVTTAAGAQAALSAVDAALDKIGKEQANLGATQSVFEQTLSGLDDSKVNQAAAQSRIADTDYGSSTSSLAQNNVKSAFAMQVAVMQNQSNQGLLNLIR